MSNNPYQSPYDQYVDKPLAHPHAAPSHSGLGVASFAISLISGLAMFALIGVATYLTAADQGNFNEESPVAIAVGFGIMGGVAMTVVGLVLGIAGLAQSNRNKLFAILGLIFNGLIVLSVCGLMALGLAVS